jgi:DNA-binding CsgD family transcriptional regulator
LTSRARPAYHEELMVGQRLVLEHRERKIVLAPGVYFVGRGDEVDLQLFDHLVSRRHAAVRVSRRGMVTIEDLGSSNGIAINGVTIREPTPIRAGDVIHIGGQELKLQREARAGHVSSHAPTERVGKPLGRARPAAAGPVKALAKLSPREQEVLRMLATGLPQREIGEILGVSVKTVETYRARIGDKLDLKTRAELVRYAVDTGILRPE